MRRVLEELIEVADFITYFIGLRLSVALGQHYTAEPLDVRWRWRHRRRQRQLAGRRQHSA